MISSDVFDGKETEVNTTIAMHLIRRGHFELADTFVRVRTPLFVSPGLTGGRKVNWKSRRRCKWSSARCTTYCKPSKPRT